MVKYYTGNCATKDCKNKTLRLPYDDEKQLKRLMEGKAYCKDCADNIITKELGIKEKKQKPPARSKKSPAAHKKKAPNVKVYCARCHKSLNKLGKLGSSTLCSECKIIKEKEKEQQRPDVKNFSQSSIDEFIQAKEV